MGPQTFDVSCRLADPTHKPACRGCPPTFAVQLSTHHSTSERFAGAMDDDEVDDDQDDD